MTRKQLFCISALGVKNEKIAAALYRKIKNRKKVSTINWEIKFELLQHFHTTRGSCSYSLQYQGSIPSTKSSL